MPTTQQTLATGVSAQEKMANRYRPVGVKGQKQDKPLTRCLWQVIGPYAHGKSRLIQTFDEAIVFNLDESPTTHPNPQAELWPLIDEVGQTVEADGTPMTLSWARVLEVIDHLIAARRARLPGTPECVVFDSLPAAIRLALYHTAMIFTNKALDIRSQGKEPHVSVDDLSAYDLSEFHGQSLFGTTYNEVADQIIRLLHNNFGVGLVAHAEKKVVELSRNKKGEVVTDERWVTSIPDPMRERLHKFLNVSVLLVRRRTSEQQERPGKERTVQVPGGGTKVVRQKGQMVEVKVDKTIIVTENEDLDKWLKVRKGLPAEFAVDSWADFAEKYRTLNT